MTYSGSLNALQRSRSLQHLSQERYDVIVVGGGVTGAGVALDAVSRGLRTALVERVDLAAGTSRWSSKLIHGGLRYLATGQLGIAYESARERHHLMTTIAPHLTRPLHNIVPDTGGLETAAFNLGIGLSDTLRRAARTPSSLLPPPRRISAADAAVLAPAARPGLRGIRYTDGQLEDDARLVATLTRTAAAHGADVVTRCAASAVRSDRLTLTDQFTGESFEARGNVTCATGVWSGEAEPRINVTPSRGSHLVVRATSLGNPAAQLSAPVPGHFGRFIFAVPVSDELVLIGLTDEAAPGADGIAPPVPDADEEFLLDTMSAVLARPLRPSDVVGRFAGLRPLVTLRQGGRQQQELDGSTADASRSHILLEEPGAPVTITGGKLTTYRQMAQDAVDAVARRVEREVPACRTTTLPLLGAAPRDVLTTVRAPERLVRRYGTLAPQVMALAETHPSFAEPVVPDSATIRAEFAYAVLHEGAFTADDLVERRTRMSFVEADADRARAVAEDVIAEFGAESSTAP